MLLGSLTVFFQLTILIVNSKIKLGTGDSNPLQLRRRLYRGYEMPVIRPRRVFPPTFS